MKDSLTPKEIDTIVRNAAQLGDFFDLMRKMLNDVQRLPKRPELAGRACKQIQEMSFEQGVEDCADAILRACGTDRREAPRLVETAESLAALAQMLGLKDKDPARLARLFGAGDKGGIDLKRTARVGLAMLRDASEDDAGDAH